MDAEVIAFGDELTSGQRVDTNSAWLSRQLRGLGIRVCFHTTAGDDRQQTITALRQAVERVDLVVTTGGLGPTADDLCREALAAVAGVPLQRNAAVLHHIQQLFARRGREMAPSNAVQADFPRGSRVIPNPQGTAPGIELAVLRADGRTASVVMLPGVPAEMRQMWNETVRVQLLAMPDVGQCCVRQREIHCFGAGESEVERMLPDLVRRGQRPTVGITAHQATITLRITAEEPSESECQAALDRVAGIIYDCLGTLVVGEDGAQLEDAVAARLVEHRLTLATVEWGTQGEVARRLAAADCGTGAYRGGLVAPVSARLWSGEVAVADPWGVDEPTDRALVRTAAERVRDLLQADWGLAIGPAPPSTVADDVGHTVQVALATGTEIYAQTCAYVGHAEIRLPRTTKQALNLVRLQLLARARSDRAAGSPDAVS